MGAITMTVRAYYLAFCNLIQQFLFTVMVTQVGDVSYFVISYVVKVPKKWPTPWSRTTLRTGGLRAAVTLRGRLSPVSPGAPLTLGSAWVLAFKATVTPA